MNGSALEQGFYMVAATLFVLGVRLMGSPARARMGNWFLAVGMVLALGITVVFVPHFDHMLVVLGVMGLGVVAGVWSGRRVRMTAMPQMVALFNGLGGGAAALVAAGSLPSVSHLTQWPALLTMVLGSLSFGGSAVAFMKLQEWISGRKYGGLWRGAGLAFLTLAVLWCLYAGVQARLDLMAGVTAMGGAALAGALLAWPIGGADMPVVISLLNALTGLSAAATGFVLQNPLLIIAGTLVGASGTILTQQMSRAMHRSLRSVIWGSHVGQTAMSTVPEAVHPITADDVAMMLRYARKVIIVPGYGLAVARAQLEVKQVSDLLEGFGVEVLFGIHPVAGRMPGHMNVLMAEANVSYDRLWEMERINPRFRETDVVLVIGANDVTNPAARTAAGSPLYGMPILNVDQAGTVIVLKRSMGRGFAGVDNPLYQDPKTRMLFGDAKNSLATLVRELEGIA
ncbi:MAG: NAD(P) transhydrogenase subunit beta [Sulfobacillus acidophilus]|uniref:NAD(P) transhydrogenase subunit beta n=1 Tax=Sulfobacillus acidophilus TaxID=53633 RepID=A0A2T2WGS3_9FIRM|nr:MAG: NAD(P) transhydrogenase subunit beta [Sulfobacillus acidophilus]